MGQENTHFVYQQPQIEFVTVAVQTCLLLEHIQELSRVEALAQLRGLLALLYAKVLAVHCPEPELDGEVERFVSEEEYDRVGQALQYMLGADDSYLDVLMQDGRYSDEPWTCYISENVADIYQELKDLAANYQSMNESVMNDALVACLEAFREHWGQKLLNALRALHAISNDNHDESEAE